MFEAKSAATREDIGGRTESSAPMPARPSRTRERYGNLFNCMSRATPSDGKPGRPAPTHTLAKAEIIMVKRKLPEYAPKRS